MLNCLRLRHGLWACLVVLLHAQTVHAITLFEGSYQQAFEKSKQEHKKLLVYVTAKWCGPCRYMERAVFQADSVTQITDRQFIAFKVDYDAWSTKPLVEKYRVAGLPTFIILDSLEAVERRVPGRLTVAEFVRFLTPPATPTEERPRFELRSTEERYRQRQIENARWKVEAGIQAGVNLTQVSPLAPGRKAGYDISLLLVCTKRRISIRPGLSLMSVGGRLEDGQPLRLQYVALPVNLS
ncbi:thioredoxin family protein [Tellurirhabdus rosea]|uniref:thioredoxin family protein n=1 Tax=Tellurirhabdus rosea TaxID=2674997 RepID=UPI00224CEAD8|nr:thioredoxin family protein [Tellurirhabdus rosea]